MPQPIRVALADEHDLMRRGLAALILAEPGLQLVAEARDGVEVIKACQGLAPDVAVLSFTLPHLGCLAAMQQLQALGLPTHPLALTIAQEDEMLPTVLASGGSGYIRKETADVDLGNAVRTAARDEVFLYASGVRLLLEHYFQAIDATETWERARPALSPREAGILRLTAEGYTNPEIGKRLSISPRAVEHDQRSIVERLGLHSRPELLRYAASHSMLPSSTTRAGGPLT